MSVVTVQKDRYTVDPLYQWDLNQVLEIRGLSLPSIPEIHFTNEAMDRAIVKQAAMNGAGVITVDVPNSLLQKPYKIKAYVCVHEGDTFETLYLIEVPVKARKKPNDYTLEDDLEVYSFNALENLVNNTVANVEAKCNDAVLSCENIAKSVDTKIAESIAVESEEYPGCYYRIVDGETEWINPPMVIGTEYRTTERYNGKPVYIKSGIVPVPNNNELSSITLNETVIFIELKGFVNQHNAFYKQLPFTTDGITLDLVALSWEKLITDDIASEFGVQATAENTFGFDVTLYAKYIKTNEEE